MKKRDKIIYWIATVWLCLGMTATGIVQLIRLPEESANFARLGFPEYLMPFLGILKFLGVIAVLMPKRPLLKEWAYSGFFFCMTGALYAHAAIADAGKEFFGPALLLVLTGLSWYFRPAERKIVSLDQQ